MRNLSDRGGSLEMMDVDAALARLKDLPADPRLEMIDSAVLSAIDFQRRHGSTLSGEVFGITAGLAMAIGLATYVVPGMRTCAPFLSQFAHPPDRAPHDTVRAA